MRRPGFDRILLYLGALAAVAGVAASGQEKQYRGEVSVEAVVAPVVVRDSAGRMVTNVSKGRFRLFVDGLEVPIRDLSLESDLPLSLGFILDTSGSMAGHKMRACVSLITAFLDERRPDDQLALWTFGDERVQERFPFGMGWYLLPRILETVRPWSTTALYDMIQRVPEVMERATHPRRAAILLTDGVDNASRLDGDDASDIAQQLHTPIYVLGVEPPPPPEGQSGASYEQMLTMIATSSGGSYQRIPRTDDMPTAVRDLREELSSRYIVTFATSGVGIRKWRTLEISVDGYDATTRKGYTGTLP
jgi:Ca-activated chloride channel family protein